MVIPLILDFINVREDSLIRHAPPFRHPLDVGNSRYIKRILGNLCKLFRDTYCQLDRISDFLIGYLTFKPCSKCEKGNTLHIYYRPFTKNLFNCIPGRWKCHPSILYSFSAYDLALVFLSYPDSPVVSNSFEGSKLSIIYIQ